MGRPLPSFSRLIGRERQRWVPFRQALSAEDQAVFDRLFECAKRQAQSEVYFPRSGSLEAVMLVVLLEHQRRIEEMRRQLADGREAREEGSPPAVRRGESPRGDTRQISLF